MEKKVEDMHRITLWISLSDWVEMGRVVPKHKRSETIRKMIGKLIKKKAVKDETK